MLKANESLDELDFATLEKLSHVMLTTGTSCTSTADTTNHFLRVGRFSSARARTTRRCGFSAATVLVS